MSLVLLSLSLYAHAGTAQEEYGVVEPRRQYVSLKLDPAADSYTGESRVMLFHSTTIEEVILHAADMDILSVSFSRGDRTWNAVWEDLGDETIAVRPAKGGIKVEGAMLPRKKAAARGEPLYARPSWVTVNITFKNDFNTQPYGLYKFEHEGTPYLVTQFEADDAREAFPCIDLPNQKVQLVLEVEAPEGLKVLGNADVLNAETEDGWTTHSFRMTRRIPTYAMAMAVGPYTSVDVPGLSVPGHLWTVEGRAKYAGALAERIAPSLDNAEDWFELQYPYHKLDVLAVPDFAFGGMENPGLIVLTDALLIDPERSSQRDMARASEVIAHEVAHMWFGDLVTLEWWDDFWLNESFATWMGQHIANELYPDEGHALRASRKAQGALLSDGRATMRPVRTEVDPNNIFQTANFLAYPKGQALLTMVERWIGKTAFQDGIRAYIKEHADQNATAEDLFAALSKSSGEDIETMLKPWLDAPGGPLVHITIGENGVLTLTQERFLLEGADAKTTQFWTIPLAVKWADDDGVHTQVVLLDGQKGDAKLPVKGELKWLLPAADAVGYLAWTLAEAPLAALIEASPEALTTQERVALVGNLQLLMYAGVLDGGTLLQHLERFSSETDVQVINEVLDAIGFASDMVDAPLKPAYAHYVSKLERPWLDAIGITPHADESADVPRLRARLLRHLAEEAEDADVLEHAQALAEDFLSDPTSVAPESSGFALSTRAKHADFEFQTELLKRAGDTQDPKLRNLYLSAAGNVPGDEARERALTLALKNDVPMRDSFALLNALEDEDQPERALEWTMEHYEALAEKLPPQFRSYLVSMASADCDEEIWARGVAFFSDESRAVPGTERAIAEGTESLKLCKAGRESHGESVRSYLTELATTDGIEGFEAESE